MNERIIVDEEETIHINRGDKLLLEYSIDNDGTNYVFQEGDYITFGIYGSGKMNVLPFVFEKFIPTAGTDVVNIEIPGEKMKFGEYINKPKTYWYEIQLNNEVTTTGYDSKGARELKLYPEGMVPNAEE